MNDNTRPAPGANRLDFGSETEMRMRTDFVLAQAAVSRSQEDYDPADEVDYAEHASAWLSGDHGSQWFNEWLYLSDATDRWSTDPVAAEATRAQLADELSPIELRSEEQAQYLAKHGIERDPWGEPNSYYVIRGSGPHIDPTSSGGSALANYQPGNALAANVANSDSEREGVDR